MNRVRRYYESAAMPTIRAFGLSASAEPKSGASPKAYAAPAALVSQ
jgi:hypothetical protein